MMDKRLKWGMIAVIACALVAWGVYSQMPKTNSELAKADKIMQGKQGEKQGAERERDNHKNRSAYR